MTLAVPLRPPLAPASRRAARTSGAVGYGLLSVGWTLFFAPIALGLLAAVAALFLAEISDSSDSTSSQASKTALVALAAHALIGSLVWWWMAHALRPFSYA